MKLAVKSNFGFRIVISDTAMSYSAASMYDCVRFTGTETKTQDKTNILLFTWNVQDDESLTHVQFLAAISCDCEGGSQSMRSFYSISLHLACNKQATTGRIIAGFFLFCPSVWHSGMQGNPHVYCYLLSCFVCACPSRYNILGRCVLKGKKARKLVIKIEIQS